MENKNILKRMMDHLENGEDKKVSAMIKRLGDRKDEVEAYIKRVYDDSFGLTASAEEVEK